MRMASKTFSAKTVRIHVPKLENQANNILFCKLEPSMNSSQGRPLSTFMLCSSDTSCFSGCCRPNDLWGTTTRVTQAKRMCSACPVWQELQGLHPSRTTWFAVWTRIETFRFWSITDSISNPPSTIRPRAWQEWDIRSGFDCTAPLNSGTLDAFHKIFGWWFWSWVSRFHDSESEGLTSTRIERMFQQLFFVSLEASAACTRCTKRNLDSGTCPSFCKGWTFCACKQQMQYKQVQCIANCNSCYAEGVICHLSRVFPCHFPSFRRCHNECHSLSGFRLFWM